ncbi:hypothetical protein ACFU8Q_25110 [Streptomyces sp. NPDC057543]|uniref:hypothetical protein n=1 Tax=Streptomyces sp. NPDC057543 TaxID=3346163 RepID=UPI0036918575
MTDGDMPEDTGVRPFAVPITDQFAHEAGETLLGYREMVEGGLSNVGLPSVNSPLRAAMATMDATPDPTGTARGALHGMLLEIAGMLWDTALDHVRALEHDIVRKPAAVWSPLVMARAVMESCLLFGYLFEPSNSCPLRLVRCAGLWRKDTDHSRSLAKVLGEEGRA